MSLRWRKCHEADFPEADFTATSARKTSAQPVNPNNRTVAYQTALMTRKGAENWYAGQTSPLVYLEFAAIPASGFVNSASSNWGFTTTFSIMIFSGGTAGSLNPVPVWATGRTLVSRTYGI